MEVNEERKQKRMAEDLAMIKDSSRWPGTLLHLKTQPWITPRFYTLLHLKTQPWVTPQHFGIIQYDDRLTVREAEDPKVIIKSYASLEELVQTWSVD
jgi:hypothetical protein